MSVAVGEPVDQKAAGHASAAANTIVSITLAAPTSPLRHHITTIVASYSGAPTGGKLTITDNGITVFEVDLGTQGPHVIDVPRALRFSAGSAVVISLAAAGASVIGKLNVASFQGR